LFLVSADLDLTIGTKDIAKMVGVKPDNLRFCDGPELGTLLGCR
jgi:hypothetical protein